MLNFVNLPKEADERITKAFKNFFEECIRVADQYNIDRDKLIHYEKAVYNELVERYSFASYQIKED